MIITIAVLVLALYCLVYALCRTSKESDAAQEMHLHMRFLERKNR